jgi:hypothetical protein
MAITAIDIIQDNIVSSVNLLAAHNPLVFIADATWNTTAPTSLVAKVIYDGVPANADVYAAIFYEDLDATSRVFIFISDEALRFRMDDLEDITQTVDTIIAITNLTKELTIRFDNGASVTDTVDIIACHASRDFEDANGAAMVDIYNNESLYYVGAVGKDLYLYWFNDNASNLIGGPPGITIGGTSTISATNARAKIIADSFYATYISGTAATKDIWCYTSTNQVIFEAQSGATITFSNVDLGASMSSAIVNNGTTSAKLTITLNSNPASGEIFEFRFTTDNTPMPPENYIDVLEWFGNEGATTYAVGFVRKKIQPTTEGITTESIYIDGVEKPHNVKVRQWCTGDQLIKYLDNNGQYRFFPFTKYYQRRSNPDPIGTISEIVLSLADDPGDTREIGYKNKNILTLSQSQLNSTEKALLEDLYNSKEVYLLVGAKYVRVIVRGDNISRLPKANFSDLIIQVELPQSYNVALL